MSKLTRAVLGFEAQPRRRHRARRVVVRDRAADAHEVPDAGRVTQVATAALARLRRAHEVELRVLALEVTEGERDPPVARAPGPVAVPGRVPLEK